MDTSEATASRQPNRSIGGNGAHPTSPSPHQGTLASTLITRTAANTGAAVTLGDERPSTMSARVRQTIEQARQTRDRSRELRLIAEHTGAIAAIACRVVSDRPAASDRLGLRLTALMSPAPADARHLDGLITASTPNSVR